MSSTPVGARFPGETLPQGPTAVGAHGWDERCGARSPDRAIEGAGACGGMA